MAPRVSLLLSLAAVLVAMTADLTASGEATSIVGAAGKHRFQIDPALAKPTYASLSAADDDGEAMVPVERPADDNIAAQVATAADGTVRAAAISATTDGESSLDSVSASRSISESTVDAIILAVRSSGFQDNIEKIASAIARSDVNGRQARFTYNIAVIRQSLLLRIVFNGVAYLKTWTYRGVDHVVVVFRSGTLYHKATNRSQFGYVAEKVIEGDGVVYFSTP